MNYHENQKLKKDITAEVLSSESYKVASDSLYDVFCLSRTIPLNPNELLIFQIHIAEIIIELQKNKSDFEKKGKLLGVAISTQLTLIVKRIVDVIVWRLFNHDRVAIQLFSEHSKTGYLDKTVKGDIEIASNIIDKNGSIVLINDLSTILRHGDLTIFANDGIYIKENKFGKASSKNRRANRQHRKLIELINFLNTSYRFIQCDNRRDFIYKADCPIETYHNNMQKVIVGAKEHGYQREDVDDVISIEAIWTRDISNTLPKERPSMVLNILRISQIFNYLIIMHLGLLLMEYFLLTQNAVFIWSQVKYS